jgi:hypothetical protein
MEVQDYTEKSIVVIGEKTKDYKDGLLKLGGKFNAKLKVGPGWVFPKTEKERVLKFVNEGIVIEKKPSYKLKEESKEEIKNVSFGSPLGIPITKDNNLLVKIDQKIDKILKEVEELKELKKLLQSMKISTTIENKQEKEEEEEYVFEEEVKLPLKKLF